MKKIIISCIIVIVAILAGLIFYSYHAKVIIDVSKVTEINVPAPSVKNPQKKCSSFTDTQSITKFITILNSSKPFNVKKVSTTLTTGNVYPIEIHNKDGSIINVQLRLFENYAEWNIVGNDGTPISETYTIPTKQATELYNILKDIPN